MYVGACICSYIYASTLKSANICTSNHLHKGVTIYILPFPFTYNNQHPEISSTVHSSLNFIAIM